MIYILETAESLGATKWVRYIRKSGLENELESAGAFTLFAPTNEAYDVRLNILNDSKKLSFSIVFVGDARRTPKSNGVLQRESE